MSDENLPQVVSVDRDRVAKALGGFIPVDTFIAHWMQALRDYRGYAGLGDLILKGAAMQLLPTLDQVALIPFHDNKTGQTTLKFMLTWRGMLALMYRSERVEHIRVELVHKKDKWSYENGVLKHSYDPFDQSRVINGPGDIVGGYVEATLKPGGQNVYHMVAVNDIEKARSCAAGGGRTGPWAKWYKQMALKTIIRDAYARQFIPIDPAVQLKINMALEEEDEILGNDPNRVATAPTPQITKVDNNADTEAAEYEAGVEEPAAPNNVENDYMENIGKTKTLDEVVTIMQVMRSDKSLTVDQKNRIMAALLKRKRELLSEGESANETA